MPSSAVRTFTDPDDYAAAVRQGTYELTVTERGHFVAKLTRIDLHGLWMQRFSDNLPRISHIAGWGGRAVMAFRTEPGQACSRAAWKCGRPILFVTARARIIIAVHPASLHTAACLCRWRRSPLSARLWSEST